MELILIILVIVLCLGNWQGSARGYYGAPVSTVVWVLLVLLIAYLLLNYTGVMGVHHHGGIW
jgi:hypothetical protein